MTTVSASGTVTISKTGSCSGTINVYLDGSTTATATINAGGKPTKGGGAFDAGSSNGWEVDVTWAGDGSATGKVFNGAGLFTDVTVVVDKPGKPLHPHTPGHTGGPLTHQPSSDKDKPQRPHSPDHKPAGQKPTGPSR